MYLAGIKNAWLMRAENWKVFLGILNFMVSKQDKISAFKLRGFSKIKIYWLAGTMDYSRVSCGRGVIIS
jgi:hypothetical protein